MLDVISLVFNEGYAASGGEAHLRVDLCAEALRLAALLTELMPDEGEALGLHALLLTHHARRDARVDAAGALVLLEDQDRDALGHRRDRAGHVAGRARPAPRPTGRYALQAAIAVEHVTAARPERIATLYDRLAALADDPIVELNRAVAIALAGDLERRARAHRRARPTTSTATTTSTPPAPTCCAAWASASRRRGRMSAPSRWPATRPSAPSSNAGYVR